MDRTVAAINAPLPPSDLSANPGDHDVRQRKMKAVDRFLRRHEVDVGKSLAVLFFAGSVMKVYSMAAQVLASAQIPFDPSGRNFDITFDFGAPLGIVLGIALWRHKSWSRTLLLFGVWFAAGLFTLMLLAIPFTGTANMTLMIGSEAIKNPPVWKVIAFGILMAPLFALSLGVLYSEKVKEEFKKPNQPPDPILPESS